MQLEIVRAMEEAVRRNPVDPRYHALLAWEYSYLWQAPDYHEKWLTAADRSMERAGRLAGERAPGIHITIGNYWIMRSKTVFPADPLWETAKSRARRHYKAALTWAPGLREEIRQFVWRFYPDEAIIRDLIGLPSAQG
jgi:hypothetical protein